MPPEELLNLKERSLHPALQLTTSASWRLRRSCGAQAECDGAGDPVHGALAEELQQANNT
jgi:hypothetical protein